MSGSQFGQRRASTPGMLAQTQFLQRGGVYQMAVMKMEEEGLIRTPDDFLEYPKMLRISRGVHPVTTRTQTIDKEWLTHTEDRELFDEIVVLDEEEEERVLAGGKSSPQIEAERQALVQKARNAGLKVNPQWSSIRLKRELGEALDAPEEPMDEMGVLKDKLARLEEMAAMKAKIAALEASLVSPAQGEMTSAVSHHEAEELRAELSAAGVKVDARWGVARLRSELDKITAPGLDAAE